MRGTYRIKKITGQRNKKLKTMTEKLSERKNKQREVEMVRW